MSTWKVVDHSNFEDETIADQLVDEGFATYDEAKLVCDNHNHIHNNGEDPTYWAVVKPDTYRLWRGMEDLV